MRIHWTIIKNTWMLCAFRYCFLMVTLESINHARRNSFTLEYEKSHLLNKDSRFRKDPQYVFFLLWQKEMREIASGVYNVMKSTKAIPMSVSNILHKVDRYQ